MAVLAAVGSASPRSRRAVQLRTGLLLDSNLLRAPLIVPSNVVIQHLTHGLPRHARNDLQGVFKFAATAVAGGAPV